MQALQAQAQEPEPEFSLQLVDNGNGFVEEQAAPTERGFIPSTAQRPRAPSPLDDATDTGVYDGKRAVEQKIAAADSSQLLDLIFVLNAPQFPWRELRNPAATVESREWFFSLRAQQTESITAEFGKALMRIGVHEFGVDPFTPTVQAMMTKEQALKAIAELQFASVDLNSREGSHSGYDGLDNREGMRTVDFMNAGYKGGTGNYYVGSSPVRIGILESGTPDRSSSCNEENWFFPNHPGFKSTLGLSRVKRYLNCVGSTCSPAVPPSYCGTTHGQRVAKIAVGSIEDGQDPLFPGSNTLDQKYRSGMAPRASIYLYRAQGTTCAEIAAAINDASIQGVDVLNHSYRVSCDSAPDQCMQNCNCGGVNTAIRNSTEAGMLHVAAVGNYPWWNPNTGVLLQADPGSAGACNVGYPAQNRDTLAVGGVGDVDTPTYDTVGVGSISRRGGKAVKINGATVADAYSLVDLVAPYNIALYYTDDGYDTYNRSGTSYAAPAVAGAAGIMRTAFRSLGYTGINARLLHATMMVMGDGFAGDLGVKTNADFDERSGAGRVHMHYPAAPSMVSPSALTLRTFNISQGGTVSFNVANGAQLPAVDWKLAMTWIDNDETNASDITVRAWATCQNGVPLNPQVDIGADWSYDVRKRIRVSSASTSGRCVRYEVTAWHIPSLGTRSVTIAEYYHSGAPSDH